jgi:NAD(P)H-dependent FMN reductase
MPKILAFAGSFREKSYNKRVLAIAVDGARKGGAEVDTVDLRDYFMPVFCPDEIAKNGFNPTALKFQELLAGYHGLLIATPEYNASVPGGMKNIFDWASRKSEKDSAYRPAYLHLQRQRPQARLPDIDHRGDLSHFFRRPVLSS